MGVLTIRNVDDRVIAGLKARARANHRSLEGELRHLLSRCADPGPDLGMMRERIRMATADRGGVAFDRRSRESADSDPSPDSGAEAGCVTWLGSMRDSGEIIGDIVSPAADAAEWEALQEPPRE